MEGKIGSCSNKEEIRDVLAKHSFMCNGQSVIPEVQRGTSMIFSTKKYIHI